MALRTLSLCAGIGGIDLGLARWSRTVCFLERDAFAAAVLVARMEEARLDRAPVWDDLRTFDGKRWRGCVDLVVAGYPCQPFSVAGKQLGERDERHLWPEVARIVAQCGAPLVFLENVPGHLRLGFDRVLADLAALGFDAEWDLVRASDVGAPHRRERLFVLAFRDGEGQRLLRSCGVLDGEREALGDDADGCGAVVADAERERSERARDAGELRGSSGDSEGEGLQRERRVDAARRGGTTRGNPDRARRTPTGSGHELDAGREPVEGCEPVGNTKGHPGHGQALEDEWQDVLEAGRAGRVVDVGDADKSRANARASSGGPRGAACESGERMGDADLARPEERRRDAEPRAFPAAWPPGPSDRAGWERWIREGGPQPVIRRGADGVPAFVDRADRLRALGNAVVPAQAARAFLGLARRALT